jgi:hypothetical protein
MEPGRVDRTVYEPTGGLSTSVVERIDKGYGGLGLSPAREVSAGASLIPSHRELLRSKAMVVSVAENSGQ